LRFKGQVFRAHNPRWSFAPLSGDGAARHGGRFNPVGTPALYTSLRMETAWLEAQQGFPFKPQPLTICAYQVDCEPVLDLTDAAILREHRITPETLACAWEDMAAIIVPSFAPGATTDDRNVVFWRWSDELPARVTLIDDEGRIPKNSISWGLNP
jgi:RES domain-containing protein